MKRIYKSNLFKVEQIVAPGKKKIPGRLILHTAGRGDHRIVAPFDGVVISSQQNESVSSKKAKRKDYIELYCASGVSAVYYPLAVRQVHTGDYIHAGDVIGVAGDEITVEARKNGRLIDACEFFGIDRRPRIYRPADYEEENYGI